LNAIVLELESWNLNTTINAITLVLLKQKGSNVNIRDREGWTALHCLVFDLVDETKDETLTVMRFLLDYGADITAQTKNGLTALHLVTSNLVEDDQVAALAVIRFLIDNGADVMAQTRNGWTALHCLTSRINY